MTPKPNINRWRAFALLGVAYFITTIDLTCVNVSLPTIGRDLHFSQTNLQWVATAYALTFGGFLLLGGRAADLLGRRRVLMLGLGLFTGDLVCVRDRHQRVVLDRDASRTGRRRGRDAAIRAVHRDEHVR